MDSNQQEKMTEPFSDRQKKNVVDLLLKSRYEVRDYNTALELLKSGRIKPMVDVTHAEWNGYRDTRVTDASDARKYFDYLQQVAAGALDSPPQTVAKAYDQLFAFIYAMRGALKIEGEQYLFSGRMLEDKLVEFSKLLHSRDEQIAKVYKRVGELSNEFYEHKEEVSTLNSSVNNLERKVEDLEKSTVDGLNHVKQVLTRIYDWLATYKEPLEWVKIEHERIHPPSEKNAKKPD